MFETGTWRHVGAIGRQRIDAGARLAAFSPDGRLLLVPVTRSRMQFVASASLAPLFELDVPDGGEILEPEFSPDGSKLAVVSLHRRVFLWELRAARQELRALGLDWSDRPIQEPMPVTAPLRLVVEQ